MRRIAGSFAELRKRIIRIFDDSVESSRVLQESGRILLFLFVFSISLAARVETIENQRSFLTPNRTIGNSTPMALSPLDSIPETGGTSLRELWTQLDDVFNDPAFNDAFFGVAIRSLNTGEYFYKRNENKLLTPASNLKLFTTASALLLLGEEYRFKTELYARGSINGTRLNGDLIVKGYGDPTISGRFYDDNKFSVFESWADSLIALGIDEIYGNIVGDDNAFDDWGLGKGWAWDYESEWYAAPSGALSFNENCIDIILKAASPFQQAEMTVSPATKYIMVINNVMTVPKDSSTSIRVFRERGTNVISVYGTIRENEDTHKTFATIHNPTQFFVVVLKDILEKKGILVRGYAVDSDDLEIPIDYISSVSLFTHYSVPFTDVIKVINKNSQNFFAEQLLKTIGFEIFKYGSAENGIQACFSVITDMGIDTDKLVMVDGSGLSPLNLISAQQFVTLLEFMYRSDFFPAFYNSLSIASIDGTLANRMKKSKARGNVRGKTGYLESIRSLSGYLYTADKEPVAFCIIANNFTVPRVLAEKIQDNVCIRLSNFKRNK